jgi:hypothetical protein
MSAEEDNDVLDDRGQASTTIAIKSLLKSIEERFFFFFFSGG